MYCEAINESVLQETNPSRDELYACMMMGYEEGSERIEWRNKGKAGKKDREETECSSSQPSSQAGDTPFEGRPRTGNKETMGFLLQKLYGDRRWHDDHFNQRPDLGQRIPGKNLTLGLWKLQVQPGVQAGCTDQSPAAWAQGLENLAKGRTWIRLLLTGTEPDCCASAPVTSSAAWKAYLSVLTEWALVWMVWLWGTVGKMSGKGMLPGKK